MNKLKNFYNKYNLTFIFSIIGCLGMLVFQIIGLINDHGIFYISSTIYFAILLIIRITSEVLLIKKVDIKTNEYFVTIGNIVSIIPLPFTLISALFFKDNNNFLFDFFIYIYPSYAIIKIVNSCIQALRYKNRINSYMIVMRNYNIQGAIYTLFMMLVSIVNIFADNYTALKIILISICSLCIGLSIALIVYDFKVINNAKLLKKERIYKILKKNNFKSTDNIIIHSSLKAIGNIEDNAEGLIEVLKDYFKEGMILFPTHSWRFMNHDEDVLNLNEANSCVGALTNVALKCGFERSHHPTHSVCGYGKNVSEYLKYDNDAKTPASPNGCFGHLKDYDFKIVFLGAKISKNTFIHSIEEEFNVEDRFTEHIYHFYSVDNENKYEFYMPKHYTPYNPHISDNYVKIYSPLKKRKILREFMFGNAESVIIDSKECYDYVSNILKENNHFFDKLE